jgi:hypothetical protein
MRWLEVVLGGRNLGRVELGRFPGHSAENPETLDLLKAYLNGDIFGLYTELSQPT